MGLRSGPLYYVALVNQVIQKVLLCDACNAEFGKESKSTPTDDETALEVREVSKCFAWHCPRHKPANHLRAVSKPGFSCSIDRG